MLHNVVIMCIHSRTTLLTNILYRSCIITHTHTHTKTHTHTNTHVKLFKHTSRNSFQQSPLRSDISFKKQHKRCVQMEVIWLLAKCDIKYPKLKVIRGFPRENTCCSTSKPARKTHFVDGRVRTRHGWNKRTALRRDVLLRSSTNVSNVSFIAKLNNVKVIAIIAVLNLIKELIYLQTTQIIRYWNTWMNNSVPERALSVL